MSPRERGAHTPADRYLTDDQVSQLNEKHGWFEHGDAQSDVSRAFAQDAIAMHEWVRAAAPELLSALKCWPLSELLAMIEDSGDEKMRQHAKWFMEVRDAAITKATGTQP